MNLDVPIADERRIEVVANGLPLWHGSRLAVDATIVSPLTRLGEAHPRADVQPGCGVTNAARRKRHQTYPELGHARRCRLVVVGIEVGGRFGGEAVQLLRLLARHRAAAVPRLLRPSAVTAWVTRWPHQVRRTLRTGTACTCVAPSAVDPTQDVLTLAAEDMASGHLRVFLLRRLRLPPPVMPRDGRCHGRLGPLDGVRPTATGGTSAITASSKVSSALEPSAPCRPFAAWQQRVDHVIGEASCL
eukprot:s3461_g7.t1